MIFGRDLGNALAWASFSVCFGLGLALSNTTVAANTTVAINSTVITNSIVAVNVSGVVPAKASAPLLPAFVSYSIEFAFFPDYAGNSSHPNTFSNNLLNNIGNLTGTKPYIRVGGNTQDYALYNPNLTVATVGTIVPSKSLDFPSILSIGPSFFDSYNTWPDTKFIHGFNLALGATTSAGWETLLNTVPLACQTLGNKLLWWEYGNEPDLYAGGVRPGSYSASTYVAEWLNGTRAIKAQIAAACPELLTNNTYGYMSHSFVGPSTAHLNYLSTMAAGMNTDKDIKLISSHNYIGGAKSPGVTLQRTLMNHTVTVNSLSVQATEAQWLAYSGIPYVLGETNSLYNQGTPGLSNSFGAALWGIDFNLYCASVGIRRVHMHQGFAFRYVAWQPRQTSTATIGTKAPYYGNIAVAAMLGNLTEDKVQIVNIPLPIDTEAAYAAYVNQKLARIAVINMRQYNYTVNGTSSVLNPVARPSRTYSFRIPQYSSIPQSSNGTVRVQRLHANGSDAISGITWDGWSYNWELNQGMPVKLTNVTTGEVLSVLGSVVTVDVQDSTAVILSF